MADGSGFFAELKRRNVLRAAVLYAGAVWALSQGISQLTPALGLPDYATRWFLVASVIGFPIWIAFAWLYEFTPQGLRRESEGVVDESIKHSTTRKLDFAIIGVMAVAIVLLASGYFFRRGAPVAAAPSAKSIAVLPFENLSGDKGNAYFASGMQDLILTKLADIGGLKVISRTSTEKYKSRPDDIRAIGEQLGVATLLEGSVQKAGNEVLINVQLIDARTDNHIWAESYTRTLTNIFGVEGEVAGKIAGALHARLSPAQVAQLAAVPTTNQAAYDAFLHAEYEANQGDTNYDTTSWKAAIQSYRQAVQADSGFALAWARLSSVESALGWRGGGGGDVQQLARQARADAEQAMKLAPGLAASRLALGYSEYYGSKDYATALATFAAALQLKPGDVDALKAKGFVLRRLGRFDDAIASLEQALVLDPRNAVLAYELGSTYAMVSLYPDAEQAFQRAFAIDPTDSSAKAAYADAILHGSGDVARALALVQDDPDMTFERFELLVYQRRYPEALALLDSIPDTPDNFDPITGTKNLTKANLFLLMGDPARARPLFLSSLPVYQAQLKLQSGILLAATWNHVGNVELGLGHTRQALASLGKSQTLIDQLQDRVNGPIFTEWNADGYAQLRRADLAVPLLARVFAAPGIGGAYSPVMLWLDPTWDPIRHDTRFQALLRQYAKYKPAVTYDHPPAS